MKFLRAVALCLLVVSVISFAACADGGAEPPEGEAQSSVYIVKTELIDGELIVTYSDGKVENLGPISGESDSDSLSFYPLPDGTYGITAGNTIYLEGIAIPEKYKGKAVSTILNDAFKGNENLKTVTIPESVVRIGASAFSECKNLETAVLPRGLEQIGASAFYGCEKLTELAIPEAVEEIGGQAFYKCTGVESISLPDADIAIGGSAFFGTAFYDEAENRTGGVLYIGNHLIDATGVSADSYTVRDNTLTVANYAFWGCGEVKKVILPDSLKRIGSSAFADCTALDSVEMSDSSSVGTVGEGAFSGCTSLKTVSMPKGISVIAKSTFSECTALTDIVIPDAVESIGALAFADCTALENVVIASDSGRLAEIGDEAFAGCEGLTGISLPLSLAKIGKNAFADCIALAEISYPATEKEWKKNVQKGTDWNKNTPEDNMKFKDEENTEEKK